MLLVLTLIGISSINTTTFETSISGNERMGTDAFYAAEAGIQVAINQVPDIFVTGHVHISSIDNYRGVNAH
jgi:Tfp pilus assembly protein PilX